jgi:probable phosphoglycerate mutase
VKLPGRAPGLHLADAGRRQAERAAARIGRLPGVAAVYASPLERARETAWPIARERGLAVWIEPDLADGDTGLWTGLDLACLRQRPEWRVIQAYPSAFRFPGGESFLEIWDRMHAVLARLVARHGGATVVAVSHGDPIKAAVAQALRVPLDRFQRFAVAPGSITAIEYGAADPKVLAISSLDGELAELARS